MKCELYSIANNTGTVYEKYPDHVECNMDSPNLEIQYTLFGEMLPRNGRLNPDHYLARRFNSILMVSYVTQKPYYFCHHTHTPLH